MNPLVLGGRAAAFQTKNNQFATFSQRPIRPPMTRLPLNDPRDTPDLLRRSHPREEPRGGEKSAIGEGDGGGEDEDGKEERNGEKEYGGERVKP